MDRKAGHEKNPMRTRQNTTTIVVLLASVLGNALCAQDDLDQIPSEEIELSHRKGTKKDASKRSFFYIGPKKKSRTPKRGYGLLLVLPGGTGGRDFHPFVKRIYQNTLDGDWVTAQLMAVSWARSKQLVWPTLKNAPTLACRSAPTAWRPLVACRAWHS